MLVAEIMTTQPPQESVLFIGTQLSNLYTAVDEERMVGLGKDPRERASCPMLLTVTSSPMMSDPAPVHDARVMSAPPPGESSVMSVMSDA